MAAALCAVVAIVAPAAASADNVVADDQIVQGSQCTGLDCVDNENFGFATQIFKENNTRVLFNDTSASAGFPTNNWGLIANSNASGGGDYFGLMDLGPDGTDVSGNGDYPFKVAAGAGNNALSVDTDGNVGIGTADATKDLQITRGDTPGLRLEQTGDSSFTPQTWDVAGNESNFFVRDITGGSKLPFRIRPGAPTSSVDIGSSGNVGFGTANPNAPIHVRRLDGSAQIKVEEDSTTTDQRYLLDLLNNGSSTIRFTDSSDPANVVWEAGTGGTSSGEFQIGTDGSTIPSLSIGSSGDVVSSAALSQSAVASQLSNTQTVNPDRVLGQISALPLQTWVYAGDSAGGRHIGPKASDLRAASGLGPASDDAVAPGDVAGLALAGVQALNKKVDALGTGTTPGTVTPAIEGQQEQNKRFRSQIAKLRKKNGKLSKRLKKLEKAVYGK